MRFKTWALLAVAASPLFADTPRNIKPAWKWTDEERVAERVHAGAAAVRAALMEQCAPHPERCAESFYIDGKHNPELFLPTELMMHVGLAWLPEKMVAIRAKWAPRATELLGDDVFNRLHKVAGVYIDAEVRSVLALREGKAALAAEKERVRALTDNKFVPLCALRAEALKAAREAFGRETFDRFLYEVVASDVRLGNSSSGGAEGVKEHLAWQEGGCRAP